MLRHTRLRRAVGISLLIAGGLLMWLAPEPAFTAVSGTGLALFLAGIVLELIGIAVERRGADRGP